MNSSYKRWSKSLLAITFALILLIMATVYLTDPLGTHSNGRFTKYTNSDNLKHFNIKLNGEYELALLGTSRLMAIDPYHIQNLVNKKIVNLALSSVSFKTQKSLAVELKHKQKNIIYGFDCFSLNTSTLDIKRHQEIHEQINTSSLKYYLDKDLLITSVKTLRNFIQNRDYNYSLIEKDNTAAVHSTSSLDKLLSSYYQRFSLPKEREILELAKIADADDIFIIYPKYQHFYSFFQKHGIEEKYFHAIKLLVNNTDAKVYCFYGINEFTRSKENFDNYGWHFKPKVGKNIFDEIYKESTAHGPSPYLLTRYNVDEVLQTLSKNISKTNINAI